MRYSILSKVALRSISALKKLYYSYLLAVILLFSLEYVLLSLMKNEYVNTFHPDLKMLVGIGVFFTTLLIIIITLYTSSFIQNNQTKEFGLYTVLGLEKKDIRFIILVQNLFNWVVTSIFSVVLGYLSGSIIFVGLNRLMRDTGATMMEYPFSIDTAIAVSVILFGTFFVNNLIHSIKLRGLNAIELLRSSNEGQSEPKNRWLMMIIGLISLGIGYYIALTTNDVVDSLLNIFIAIFFVMIGTYLLFSSLSVFVLKSLKNNKRIYYKPNNFLSISGMLHRMNNNSVSLSSIAILCSGVILVLGLTLSLYRTMEGQIDKAMPYQFEISPVSEESYEADVTENEALMEEIIEQVSEQGEVSDANIRSDVMMFGYLDGQKLQPLPGVDTQEAKELENSGSGQRVILQVETIDSYNGFTGENERLEDGEVLITSNLLDTSKLDHIDVNGNEYSTKKVSDEVVPANFAVEIIYLAFPTQTEIDQVRQVYLSYNQSDNSYYEENYSTTAYFNVEGDSENIKSTLNKLADEYTLSVEEQEEFSQQMYLLYGGLLFIGLVVSAVLLIGTVLMLYFKQISEGYEDRENYRIMQQVGLPNSLIQKTINSQIIWVFALPILVAIIHNLFASKIVYTLVGLFGSRDLTVFMTSYFGVLVVFSLVYLIFYRLTSNTYYKIIK